ncbi:MAG: hypothetical protein ABIH64_05765 [Nanoarchaeota archaeon]
MKKTRCIRCGLMIKKSAINDPYLCRDCEKDMMPEERFAYFDS